MSKERATTLRFVLLFVVGAIILGGATLLRNAGQEDNTSATSELMPALTGYTVVEGQTLTDYLSTISEGAAALAGQPEVIAAVAAVDHVITCYQRAGALQARIYSKQERPLSAGIVAIVDRNALLDPANLAECVAPVLPDIPPDASYQFCSSHYTLARGDNEFYIVYAGTTPEICQDFCTSLEGCIISP